MRNGIYSLLLTPNVLTFYITKSGEQILTTSQIEMNIASIKNRVAAACKKAGRGSDSVSIVAVSKTVDSDIALKVVRGGIKALGENRTKEMAVKHRAINEDISWHFVGHLQRNKVKEIIRFVDLIHSLESISLAEEIDRRAKDFGKVQEVLIEINISGEKSKYGLHPDQVFGFIKKVKDFDNLRIKGLMTMAPYGAKEGRVRGVFSQLRDIRAALAVDGNSLEHLSMGMTDDFEIAIEEGADIVRIGRAFFS